jgi:phosphoribosyl-ATP pyrophosphohydrolase
MHGAFSMNYTYVVVIRDDQHHIVRQIMEASLEGCIHVAKAMAEHAPHNVFVERVDETYHRKIVWPSEK